MRRLLGYLYYLTGWGLIYLMGGLLLGMTLAGPMPGDLECGSCWPHNSVFGVIETSCPSPVASWFWNLTVGYPRLAIVFPALAISFYKAAAKSLYRGWMQGDSHGIAAYSAAGFAGNALPFLLPSLLVASLMGLGASYWYRRNRAFGISLGVAGAGSTIWLGMSL